VIQWARGQDPPCSRGTSRRVTPPTQPPAEEFGGSSFDQALPLRRTCISPIWWTITARSKATLSLYWLRDDPHCPCLPSRRIFAAGGEPRHCNHISQSSDSSSSARSSIGSAPSSWFPVTRAPLLNNCSPKTSQRSCMPKMNF